jgi:spore maturation protein SpmA
MLNGLWLGFFIIAALTASVRLLISGDAAAFAAVAESLFSMAKLSVDVMILLFGTLTLWLGFLKIAEKASLIDLLARLLSPLFRRLMPEVPAGHPALGLITLNFTANALGLDNAATPIGLKAMRALQDLNPNPASASNAQILFLVLNASSLTLLPVSIFMYRTQQGAENPTLVFLPSRDSCLDCGGFLFRRFHATPEIVGSSGICLAWRNGAGICRCRDCNGEHVGIGAFRTFLSVGECGVV